MFGMRLLILMETLSTNSSEAWSFDTFADLKFLYYTWFGERDVFAAIPTWLIWDCRLELFKNTEPHTWQGYACSSVCL